MVVKKKFRPKEIDPVRKYNLIRVIALFGVVILFILFILFRTGISFNNMDVPVSSNGISNLSRINILSSFNEVLEAFLLSFLSLIIVELFVNWNYEKKLHEYLHSILTNSNLMKHFIDSSHKREIMKVSLSAVLGKKIANTIEAVIINNYLIESHNMMRKDYYCYISVSENNQNSQFYKLKININFKISESKHDLVLTVGGYSKQDEIEKAKGRIKPRNYFLFFPFLLADGADVENTDDFNVHIENGSISFDTDKKVWEMKIKKRNLPKHINMTIDTLLNKNENFFYDDIHCVHDGYHISFNYNIQDIRKCRCYHSCKSDNLITTVSENSCRVDVDNIVLPENNFVFIWEQKNNVGISN